MSLNHYREAAKEKANIVGIATSVALTAALVNPLPLLAGLVLEAAYLTLVPDSPWYRARLARREKEEAEKRRQAFKAQVLPTLRAEMQQRYARLEAMRAQIATQTEPQQKWFSDMTPKLDYLLDKFLVFAGKEAMFLQYLRNVREEVCGTDANMRHAQENRGDRPARQAGGSQNAASKPIQLPTDPMARWGQQTVEMVHAAYDGEMEEINRELASEREESTRTVLQKRAEILSRRSEFLDKIGKMLLNLGHQLQLLEDTFGLINDQLRARTPEQIVADIDDVISQTDSMTRVLEELAPYEQMVSSAGRSISM